MPKELTGADSFPATVQCPVDGDEGEAITVEAGLQDLTDRTTYLNNRLGTGVPELSANRFLARASTGVTEGKVATDFMIALMASAGAINAADAVHTQGSAVASASSIALGSTTGMLVQITGSTDIASFGTAAAGNVRLLRFEGSLTLEHSASLLLPGSADITTQVNDRAIAVSLGSGVWIVYDYTRAAPSPIVETLTLLTNDEYDATVVHDVPFTGMLSHAEIVRVVADDLESVITGLALKTAAMRRKTFVNRSGATLEFTDSKPFDESLPENKIDLGRNDNDTGDVAVFYLYDGHSATFYYDPVDDLVRILHAHPNVAQA